MTFSASAVATVRDDAYRQHIALHDPRDVIARALADLELLDDILAERHYVGDDLYYSCSTATQERDGGEIPNPDL
jgi:hypothetical protein